MKLWLGRCLMAGWETLICLIAWLFGECAK